MILSYVKQKTAGLANLGNTCFMNACLQILAHTFELNEVVVKPSKFNKGTSDTQIMGEWRELLVEMWRKKGGAPSVKNPSMSAVIQPRKFVFYVQQVARVKGRDLFAGHSQNDFSEFLHFFVDCLHESLGRPVNMIIRGDVANDTDAVALQTYKMLQKDYGVKYSEVLSVFNGVIVSEIWSEDGAKRHSTKPETFFTLDLPLAPTLLDSFRGFTTGEVMQGDNAWLNEATGRKETVLKRLRFWSFPPVLVVVLKRFTNQGRKDGAFVQYPLQGLDLDEFKCGYKRIASVYDLYGVACHVGNAGGGHYYCHVLNSVTGVWHTYDDEAFAAVEDAQQLVSPHAYCLFYRLRAK